MMPRDYDRERDLVNSFHWSRLLLDLGAGTTLDSIAFRMTCSDIKAYILSTGQPLFDFGRGSQLEIDANGDVQEVKLGTDRFRDWMGDGAASLARRAG